MRVCGVELAGNDANIALLNLDSGMFCSLIAVQEK